MEVLNERAALLSNFEVLQVVQELEAIREANPRLDSRSQQNLNTIVYEVREYLDSTPCATQTPEQISAFLTEMKATALTKAERLQLLNLRPETVLGLTVMVEECDARFSDEAQEAMVEKITNILTPAPAVEGAGVDESGADHSGHHAVTQQPEHDDEGGVSDEGDGDDIDAEDGDVDDGDGDGMPEFMPESAGRASKEDE